MSEEVQKPPLTIDLVAKEGHVFALVGKACVTLERAGQVEQAEALRTWFRGLPYLDSGVSYDDVRHEVERYCDVTWLHGRPPTTKQHQNQNPGFSGQGVE